MVSALKRLKVAEDTERVSWRNPRFADWQLTWCSNSANGKSWDVHRCIVVGGPRAANFFAGATREVYDSQTTELSVLLPDQCKDHMDRALDFIYGIDLGDVAMQDLMPLMKIADVLQCPTLQNTLVDIMETCASPAIGETGGIEVLLRDACALDMMPMAEMLVSVMPTNMLQALDVDLLEIDCVSLMRAVARRIAQARSSQWGVFLGHGHISPAGGLAIALPAANAERSRKGYWCHAMGAAETRKQTWKLRVDHVPVVRDAAWDIVIGVVGGKMPSLRSLTTFDALYTTYCEAGAYLSFAHAPQTMDFSEVRQRLCLGTESRWSPRPLDEAQAERIRLCVGDIITVAISTPSDGKGDVRWHRNGVLVGHLEKELPEMAYRICAELYYSEKYLSAELQITLLEPDN